MSALLARWLCLAALLLGSFGSFARAQESELPRNDGWVTDTAGVLSPSEERKLESLLESLRRNTTNEIAVVVLPDLGGQPIERVALELGRRWKVGAKDKNNGVVLCVAIAERKLRIEVGSGLEGDLTDAEAGRIIREEIAPSFRAGKLYEGLFHGIAAIHTRISDQPLPAEVVKAQQGQRSEHRKSLFSGVIGLVFALFLLFVVLGGIGRGRGGVGSALPWILMSSGRHRGGGGGFGGGGFGGFGGGGGFSGGGASGGW